VIGSQRYSRDLEQGGMEIPCKYTFKGPPRSRKSSKSSKFEKFKKFKGALKTEVQVNSSDNSDHIFYAALELTVPGPISMANTFVPPEKCALDLADDMECCSVADKHFKPNDFKSKPSSSADISISTDHTEDSTLLDMPLCKPDGAVKLNESGTQGKPTIDLTAAVTFMKSIDTKQVWVQFQRNTLKMKDKCLVEDGVG